MVCGTTGDKEGAWAYIRYVKSGVLPAVHRAGVRSVNKATQPDSTPSRASQVVCGLDDVRVVSERKRLDYRCLLKVYDDVRERSATVGSVLSNGVTITAITAHSGGIINPIVAGGTILASDKAGGAPVLAATADEWTANVLLSAYPKFSPSFALAALFPATVQAYYDDALEPFFNAAVPTLRTLKVAAPAPLVGLALIAGDAALVAGLGAYALGLNGAATLAAAALAVAAARRAARK